MRIENDGEIDGALLKHWRQRLGWSQDQAAKALGFAHRVSIVKFESGERSIDRWLELACRWLEEHQGEQSEKGT